MQKHTQRLFNHTRIKPAQQDTYCRPGKPLGTTKKLEKDQTLVAAQPCLPQPPSPSFKHQAKFSKNDPRSIFPGTIYMIMKEREFHSFQNDFALKNGLVTSLSKNSAHSQIVLKFIKLIFKSIG